jgi:Ca-activated chloride channel family protein
MIQLALRYELMKKSTLILGVMGFFLLSLTQSPPLKVKIISPKEKTFPTGPTEIIAEVEKADSVSISRVEFYVNDRLIGVASKPPYRVIWQAPFEGEQTIIEAIAFADDGTFARDRVMVSAVTASYRVKVNLVSVYATVLDREGNYVLGLTKDDFIVYEDGVPQVISNFSKEETPLELAFLIDISSSMYGERIKRAQDSAIELVERLVAGENRALVMGFDDQVFLYQTLTGDKKRLTNTIREMNPNGGTALYDAVAYVVRSLKQISGKKAIILLSDGDDTDSNFTFDDVLDYVREADVLIYSVGLQKLTFSQTFIKETELTVRQLTETAEVTGGRAYFPNYINRLPGIYRRIGKELKSQYTLGYIPKRREWDGSWRRIKVVVKDRPYLIIRAREGYYAAP